MRCEVRVAVAMLYISDQIGKAWQASMMGRICEIAAYHSVSLKIVYPLITPQLSTLDILEAL